MSRSMTLMIGLCVRHNVEEEKKKKQEEDDILFYKNNILFGILIIDYYTMR